MGLSMLDIQRDIILDLIKNTAPGQWKVLVVDQASRKIIDNVVKEDDILGYNITYITEIETKRQPDKDMDVLYILSPQPHIIDCLISDFEKRRYRRAYLVWTSIPPPALRERLDKNRIVQEQIASFTVKNIDYYPRESNLVTFRDPWSFPVLFHPGANHLVKKHLEDLASKIVAVCVALGEYPIIRYYRPNSNHEASVLCSHLASFVEGEIDMYAQYHQNFPPPSSRPRAVLYIVDRTMDIISPFLHEFTYQAMAHDLLSIQERDKITYKTIVNAGRPEQEEVEMEISEKDKIWLDYRHQHMKDTIVKLMSDFERFKRENPSFTNQDANTTSLNSIKDMMANLPQFQEMKEAYSLHLSMAQDCMKVFQERKLPDVALVEQSLATGLDEDYRKPKNLADSLVRTLDEPSIPPPDRLRLIALYLLYKDGLIPADLQKLLAHAQLPPQDSSALTNLDMLGVQVSRKLKDPRPPTQPLFPFRPPPPTQGEEEYALARYVPALKSMLEQHCAGTLSQDTFPSTKPELDSPADAAAIAQATSLRSAKPTWAKSRAVTTAPTNQQRVIVFMAGGATYAESRACYEISREKQREVVLVTSHMQTPGLFLRQVAELSANPRQLRLPLEAPPQKTPEWVFEKEAPPAPPKSALPAGPKPGVSAPKPAPQPLTQAMGRIDLNGGAPGSSGSHGGKDEDKKKKKHHFFHHSKKDKK